MKTVAILFVLSCLSLSFVNSMNETKWGNVNTKVLGQENVVAQRVIGYYQVGAFAFPSDNSTRVPITGIKHINHLENPVNVTFAYGQINRTEIAIVIKSAYSRGINSTFIFYGH